MLSKKLLLYIKPLEIKSIYAIEKVVEYLFLTKRILFIDKLPQMGMVGGGERPDNHLFLHDNDAVDVLVSEEIAVFLDGNSAHVSEVESDPG